MADKKMCKCRCGGDALLEKYNPSCSPYFCLAFDGKAIVCSKHCGMRTKWYAKKGDAINAWNKMMGEKNEN